MDEILCLKSKINLLTTQLEQTKMLLEGQNNVVSALKEQNKEWEDEISRIKLIGSYGILDEMKKTDKYKKVLEKIEKTIEEYKEEQCRDCCYKGCEECYGENCYECEEKILDLIKEVNNVSTNR